MRNANIDFLLSCIIDNKICQFLQDVSCETRIFNLVRRPRGASLNLPSHAFLKDVWGEMRVFAASTQSKIFTFARMSEAKYKIWVVKGPPKPSFFKDSGPSRTFIFQGCLMRNANFEFSLSCINENQKYPVLKDI